LTATTASPASATTDASVREAYEFCSAATRRAATNFYYAFQTLSRPRRDAIYAAYAFCRECDDIVDEPARRPHGAEELAAMRARLAAAYDGQAEGPLWVAMADAARRFGIKQSHFQDVIDGCEMDLVKSRYATFAELELYCARVAGAVGLIVIEVCGYTDSRAEQHAADLGTAMQLTNIVRDLAEDLRNGRVYIPQDELAAAGCTEEMLRGGNVSGPVRSLLMAQVQRAREYFTRGEGLFQYLDRRSRACPETIAVVYRKLLDRIEAADYDVFSRRVSLSRRQKAALAARLWLRSRLPLG
jgi:phytoene synthase